MITTTEIGKHKPKTVVFQNGDIMMTKVYFDGGDCGLLFSEVPGRQIGDETSEFSGYGTESLNKLPDCPVGLIFENPKSITALIHSLIEIQQYMFKTKGI